MKNRVKVEQVVTALYGAPTSDSSDRSAVGRVHRLVVCVKYEQLGPRWRDTVVLRFIRWA
jgi:hypothetical protein